MELRVAGISTAEAEQFRAGGADANGQAPVVRAAHGVANPCRHCLSLIAEGEPMLILAYRPFDPPAQPYAETGPIFLHQRACLRYDGNALPAWFKFLDPAAIRGYGRDGWIRYETGQIVPGANLAEASAAILSAPDVAYVHIRSKFGCFQCRVDRA